MVITSHQDAVVHPYGPRSSFELMREYRVKILGLGVTLNTTSLAPIADYQLGIRHTQRVFTEEPQVGTIIDGKGQKLQIGSFSLMPEAVRQMKPSIVFDRSAALRDAMRRVDEGGTIQFAYPFEVYHAEAVRLGGAACARGSRVPWLPEYPLCSSDIGTIC
jgi:hypothetical protein